MYMNDHPSRQHSLQFSIYIHAVRYRKIGVHKAGPVYDRPITIPGK